MDALCRERLRHPVTTAHKLRSAGDVPPTWHGGADGLTSVSVVVSKEADDAFYTLEKVRLLNTCSLLLYC